MFGEKNSGGIFNAKTLFAAIIFLMVIALATRASGSAGSVGAKALAVGAGLLGTGMVLFILYRRKVQEMKQRIDDVTRKSFVLQARLDEAIAGKLKAENSSRGKFSIMATISHEVRNHLNGVVALNEMLMISGLNAEQSEYARLMKLSSDALLRILDDTLAYAKMDAGHVINEKRIFDPYVTLSEIRDVFIHMARRKGIDLTCSYDNDMQNFVSGDPGRLKQMLINLLGNSIKFTDAGSVRLCCAQMDAPAGDNRVWLRFEIIDTGIGINPDSVDGLFDPFVQAVESTALKYGGTGLGLAISKQIADSMGGSISVRSAVGYGSTFCVDIPFECVKPNESVLIEDNAPAEYSPVFTGSRVLVAEDNSVSQKVLRDFLQHLGCRADIVADGKQAIEAVASDCYDLVLLDCRMPVMDGYAACRSIRAAEVSGKRIPVIAVTASTLEEDREKCGAAGMDDFIAKPIKLDELSVVLSRWLVDRNP